MTTTMPLYRTEASPLRGVDIGALLDAMPAAAVVLTPAGDVVAANGRAEDLLAMPAAAALGRPVEGGFQLFRERAQRNGAGEHVRFVQPFGMLWYLVDSYPLA